VFFHFLEHSLKAEGNVLKAKEIKLYIVPITLLYKRTSHGHLNLKLWNDEVNFAISQTYVL